MTTITPDHPKTRVISPRKIDHCRTNYLVHAPGRQGVNLGRTVFKTPHGKYDYYNAYLAHVMRRKGDNLADEVIDHLRVDLPLGNNLLHVCTLALELLLDRAGTYSRSRV
jgi:hypothetical protein